MIPIGIDPSRVRIGLVGLLRAAGADVLVREWRDRLDRVADERAAACASGRPMAEVARETSLLVGAAGWPG